MKVFGVPTEKELPITATPIGVPCGHCQEPIENGDIGFVLPHFGTKGEPDRYPYHQACMIRMTTGGYNHLRGLCTCCGGTLDPDPAGVSVRRAAEMARDEFERQQTALRSLKS